MTCTLYCACYIIWYCSAALLMYNMHCAHYFIQNCSAALATCILHCACYNMKYYTAALEWLSNRNGIEALFFLYRERKSFPPFPWYGGATPAILEDSSVTNKGAKVRTNIYSKSCWFGYVICYVTANVCTVTGASLLIGYRQILWATILSKKFQLSKMKKFTK